MKASEKSVLKAKLERNGSSIRTYRKKRNIHRGRFMMGRRPLIRKRTKEWIENQYGDNGASPPKRDLPAEDPVPKVETKPERGGFGQYLRSKIGRFLPGKGAR